MSVEQVVIDPARGPTQAALRPQLSGRGTGRSWWQPHFGWPSSPAGCGGCARTTSRCPRPCWRRCAGFETNPLAPLLYIVIYALRPLTLFSSTLLTIAGGFLFGPFWGIVYTVIGANASATVAFAIGRYFGQDLLTDDTSDSLMQRYARRMREHSFETVLVMRFHLYPLRSGELPVGSAAHSLPRPLFWPQRLAPFRARFAFVLLGASASPQDIDQLFLTGQLPSLDWRVLVLSRRDVCASASCWHACSAERRTLSEPRFA